MHPYRTSSERDDTSREPPAPGLSDAFESRLVELVLFTVGALGVIIGLVHPPSVVELTIGSCLVVLVISGWLARDGSSRRRRRESDP